MRLLGIAVFILMTLTLIYGFASGDGFFDQGGDLLAMPWGKVTVIDLYLALGVFGVWIVKREGFARAFPWLVGLAVGGSLTVGLYLIFRTNKEIRPSSGETPLP